MSTRKHWRGPPRLPRAPDSNAGTPTPQGTIRKVSEYVEQRQRLLNRKQQLPRESMAKCAKSVGDIFLSAGVTFSSVCFSCNTPHGAVASSRCRPKAVTCIVLKMFVIGSNLASIFWTNRQKIRTPEQFSSTAKESTLLYRLNATHLPKGVIMGKLEGKVAVITGGSRGLG